MKLKIVIEHDDPLIAYIRKPSIFDDPKLILEVDFSTVKRWVKAINEWEKVQDEISILTHKCGIY